ncbi:MAG: sialate O-acetylesterase [bacterium]|nr:sialate O-acetylesterase [bacterium]
MLKPAAVFSNHMVLQQKKNITIWGKTDSKEKITVSMHNQVVDAMIYDDCFEANLHPMEAGGPYDMVIRQGEEVVRFLDIMIGEVWYAGGQSNMELPLIDSLNGKEKVDSLRKNNKIRFYQVQRKSFIDEAFYKGEETTSWEVYSKDTCGTWSAVATYYAEYLQKELGVPVGIIGCNLGATSASCWVSKDKLERDSDTYCYIEDYHKAMEGKSLEQYEQELKAFNEWYSVWQKKVDELYAKDPKIEWSKVEEIAGVCEWPEPLGPKSPFRPGGLHETMTKRVAGYALRGFLYYQGEEDANRASSYGKLLRMVIEQLREDWNDDTLPFVNVQLPRHIYKQDADHGEWAVLRDQQMKVFKTVANTGLAVTIDQGEFNNIHPLDKSKVGKRLAKQALSLVYKKKGKAFGPMYKNALIKEDGVLLQFHKVKGDLIYKEDLLYKSTRDKYCPIEDVHPVVSENGFEVAGRDGVFYAAEIELNDSEIHVSSANVTEIVVVRYAYHNFSPVTIFDQSGLPLHPFCKKIRALKLEN